MEREKDERETVEKLEIKEEKELIEWIKQSIPSGEVVYIHFVGELKNNEIYISCGERIYRPRYVKWKEFIHVIREVTVYFNNKDGYRAVSVVPQRNAGEIDFYLFIM